MATAAVIGLSGGKRLLSSSYHYSDVIEKLSYGSDFGSTHYQIVPTKSLIAAKKSSNYTPTFPALTSAAKEEPPQNNPFQSFPPLSH